ncbi:helix-turn-helix domain-containing protein [Nonomuraea sp. NPDC049709]|uniref:winged helix-turn-helix transcriptional regulator n=1 Tax=Nonomuraea sp. NPDC049709 TaxID=3154736 RepID=UPI0034298E0A
MSRRNTAVTDQVDECPLPQVLALIGDKWCIQILVELGLGPRRFSRLERAIEGISRRMLTLNLRNLERNGLITRTVRPDSPPSVEYAVTPLAEDIREPLEALAQWARRAIPSLVAARRDYDSRS